MISRSNIIWFSVLLALVLIAAGFFALRIQPVMKQAGSLSRELDRMLSQRRELASRPEGPPSQILFEAAQKQTKLKEAIFDEIESKLSIKVPDLLPEGTTRPSIYWLDSLRRKRVQLLAKAEQSGLVVPSDLGFRDELPSDERVPVLLLRLFVTEEFIGKAAESNLRSISALRFEEAPAATDRRYLYAAQPASGAGFGSPAAGLEDMGVMKVPVRFTVEASLENLFSFMFSLESGSFLYIIDDMKLTAVELERTEAEPAGRTETGRLHAPSIPGRGMPAEGFWGERFAERPQTKITERFLEVEFEVSMHYIQGKDRLDASATSADVPLFDAAPGIWEQPGGASPDPGERRRIPR